MTKCPVRVFVVDDYEPFRSVVRSILALRDDLQIIGEASDGFEAVRKAQILQPDVILLDIGLPGLNGISVAKRLRQLWLQAQILFLSEESDSEIVEEALKVASGYVLKLRVHTELLRAIETVLRGEQFIDRKLHCEISGTTIDTTRRHRHEVLFCSDDTSLLDGFGRFISAALSSGNPVMVVATEPHKNALVQRLRREGIEIDAAMRQGTCVWLDAAEDLDVNRFLDIVADALESAAKAAQTTQPRLALCGERAGRLWAEGKKDVALQIERFCDDLGRTHEIDILCAYPLPKEGADLEFERISAAHSAERTE